MQAPEKYRRRATLRGGTLKTHAAYSRIRAGVDARDKVPAEPGLAARIGNVLMPRPTCYTAFQRHLGGKKGGPEVLLAIGFVEQDGKLVVTDLDVEWLKVASGELQVAAKRGPFY